MTKSFMYRSVMICLLVALTATIIVHAQPDPTPTTSVIESSGWLMIDLDEPASPDETENIVVFLNLDDGDTLVEVARGVDMIYQRGDDGSYSGAPLIPTDIFTYEITLELIDDAARQVASSVSDGSYTYESNLRYERLDVSYTVWTEVERNIIEFTMIGECLGLVDAVPGSAWTRLDLLTPIRIDEEAGILYMGGEAYSGGDGVYELVEEGPFGQFMQVTTRTVTVAEDSIAYRHHSIADERDDCEMIYESSFVPFDGDAESLFERAATLAET